MKKYQLYLLSVLTGLLFTVAWPAGGFPGLLFVAFIPLLFVEDFISNNKERFHRFSIFPFAYLAFFIWNLLTTYWIWNSTVVGGVLAVGFNSLLMALVFTLYHFTKKSLYSRHGYFVLIFYWISFEYIHTLWSLNWPWLNLGNGFASFHKWVQWYEYTGVFGGSFWVILVNILIYQSLMAFFSKEKNRKKGRILSGVSLFLIIIPLIVSFIIYHNYKEKEYPVEVVVVQPNLDPYSEQYELPPQEVINRNLGLAMQVLDSNTKFIVCTESAIQENIWERKLHYSGSLRQLKRFLMNHPHVSMIIGASTFKEFRDGEPITHTARKFRDYDAYYDAYNTVFLLDTNDITQWHHKSKLTPGVEIMPLVKYMKFIEKLAIDLGGTVGSLGMDAERKVFKTEYDSLLVAAVICYESVYGEFMSEFVKNGANLLFIVTNDGWWGNTPGHRQHFSFAPLRAIETRRSIARSGNTGISAFIDQRGDVFQKTKYWEPTVIKQNLNASWDITFYVKFGDYIARIASFFSVLFLLITIVIRITGKKRLG